VSKNEKCKDYEDALELSREVSTGIKAPSSDTLAL
jgi:hypothetical protein